LNNHAKQHYDTEQLLGTLQEKLQALIHTQGLDNPVMIGIHSGGAWIAERLHQGLALATPLGLLDISFYRDDFTRIGINPEVKPSNIPINIDDRHLILIDDVLHTGRTIRAAMNELFDYGRPASIHLGVLVNRSGRELPIQADASALHIDLSPGQHIKLQGPEPLELLVIDGHNHG
jgi:pyrimidine operon attenuation protein/uracil phosphoribosyltransferase